jgi:hypothetical protein
MKVVEYKTAHGGSVRELDRTVNQMISEGFQPFGSPYLSESEVEGVTDTFAVWQAMVRYDHTVEATGAKAVIQQAAN